MEALLEGLLIMYNSVIKKCDKSNKLIRSK